MSNINKVATKHHHFNFSRLKKDELFDRLTVYINSLNDDELADNMPLLTNLYDKFQPSITGKYKTGLDILKKVIPKNDIRYYLNYIYVDKDYLVATDGHRMAYMPNSNNIEAGFYDKNMNKVDCDGKYLDYMQVIPKNNFDTVIIKSTGIKYVVSQSIEYAQFNVTDNCIFNCRSKYLTDVIKDVDSFTVSFNLSEIRASESYTSGIKIKRNDFKELDMLLMPCRL